MTKTTTFNITENRKGELWAIYWTSIGKRVNTKYSIVLKLSENGYAERRPDDTCLLTEKGFDALSLNSEGFADYNDYLIRVANARIEFWLAKRDAAIRKPKDYPARYYGNAPETFQTNADYWLAIAEPKVETPAAETPQPAPVPTITPAEAVTLLGDDTGETVAPYATGDKVIIYGETHTVASCHTRWTDDENWAWYVRTYEGNGEPLGFIESVVKPAPVAPELLAELTLEHYPRDEKDIEDLKRGWMRDPIWDIEDTEGFEYHYNELREFRKQQEAAWKASREAELQQFADNLGIGDNLALAGYIRSLQYRIDELERETIK